MNGQKMRSPNRRWMFEFVFVHRHNIKEMEWWRLCVCWLNHCVVIKMPHCKCALNSRKNGQIMLCFVNDFFFFFKCWEDSTTTTTTNDFHVSAFYNEDNNIFVNVDVKSMANLLKLYYAYWLLLFSIITICTFEGSPNWFLNIME